MLKIARALAKRFVELVNPLPRKFRNVMDSIPLFVLLDLLGFADTYIPSYYMTTHWAYKNMAEIERRLRTLCQMRSSRHYVDAAQSKKCALSAKGQLREDRWLHEHHRSPNAKFLGGSIEDDHLPFLKRGREILHLIPLKFPWVWHQKEDDGKHLHIPTVQDWAQIMTAFAAEWMNLEGFMPQKPKSSLIQRSEDILEESSWDDEFEQRDEL
jgi:glutaminyl-peptide cyclotransferase